MRACAAAARGLLIERDVLGELLTRFALGGAIVSVFSVAGSVFQPKRFAGVFGAAPSVAIVTLALAFAHGGADQVRLQGRAMLCGAVAMLVYCAACIALTRREHLPVWLAAGLSWISWLAVALGLAKLTGLA